MENFRGNFIDGAFVRPAGGEAFSSENPAAPGVGLFEAVASPDAAADAIAAARGAGLAWQRTSLEERVAAVRRIQEKLPKHLDGIAEAIRLEMGKVASEARIEAGAISGKIDALIRLLPSELAGSSDGAPGECRHHPLGVTVIVGPFNFPVHLLHTHVVPALLTGNTVVAKPSEVTPLTGQRYAALLQDAGLPDGVFNLVQGMGATGAALVAHPDVRGVAFTGSYATGRAIRKATFDQPYKKVCLELGGKNPAVVLDDADLEQTVREILLGALLTTGQRCTATSRVIATPGIADALCERLVRAFQNVRPEAPESEQAFMGPLATRASFERFQAILAAARGAGTEELVTSQTLDGGYYVTPGLSLVEGEENLVSEELFGPHISFERASDEADAFARAAANPFGLSASLFSARREAFERFYMTIPAGVMNFNRSTNGASGLLPFGGVGRSGNFRPTGSGSLRLCTYPVAVMEQPLGKLTSHARLENWLGE